MRTSLVLHMLRKPKDGHILELGWEHTDGSQCIICGIRDVVACFAYKMVNAVLTHVRAFIVGHM